MDRPTVVALFATAAENANYRHETNVSTRIEDVHDGEVFILDTRRGPSDLIAFIQESTLLVFDTYGDEDGTDETMASLQKAQQIHPDARLAKPGFVSYVWRNLVR